MYNLIPDGDKYEQIAYPLFIESDFPSYEIFWRNFIVPLTNRPTDIYTKTDEELRVIFPNDSIEKIHEKVVILQLHYSVLRMLLKASQRKEPAGIDINAVEECFSSLYSALDISAELFARYERIKSGSVFTISSFDPQTAEKNSFALRKRWQKNNPYPKEIENIRRYRNLMLHGQAFGSMATSAAGFLILPKPNSIEKYFDWRKIGTSYHSNAIFDFLHSVHIVDDSCKKVLQFLEVEWRRNLI